MLHKYFQWRQRRKRWGSNPYRKIEDRSKSQDLLHSFQEFGGDDSNTTHSSRWFVLRIAKTLSACTIIALAVWFAYESYHGLLIYD